jgi:hypothetical protein
VIFFFFSITALTTTTTHYMDTVEDPPIRHDTLHGQRSAQSDMVHSTG